MPKLNRPLALYLLILLSPATSQAEVITGKITFTTTWASAASNEFSVGKTFIDTFSYDSTQIYKNYWGNYVAPALSFPVMGGNVWSSYPAFVYFKDGVTPSGIDSRSYVGNIGWSYLSFFDLVPEQIGQPGWQYTKVGYSQNFNAEGTYSISALSPVPEPKSYAMLLSGLGLLGCLVLRKRNQYGTNEANRNFR